MQSRQRRFVIPMGVVLLLAGCTTAMGERKRGNQSGVSREAGAIVLTGAALRDGPGNLLATLVGKIPNFRLQQNAGRCPIIRLRGAVSFQGLVNPHVYVDGTRATDTCVLNSLRNLDVERVEVYPMGFTIRPGYGTHAHGLILVFMR